MCGFVGVIGVPHAARELFIALQTVQHRGQDSAGIATKDGDRFPLLKEMGTVPLALREHELGSLHGRSGIGHVRYPTFGRPVRDDAQPFFNRQPGLLMAHNGNVTNYDELKSRLGNSSIHLLSSCDVEPVMCLMSEKLMALRPRDHTIDDAVEVIREIQETVKGAYTIVVLGELEGKDTMILFRDRLGLRPGVWGSREGAYMVASESVALDALGYKYEGQADPAEVLFFRENEPVIRRVVSTTEKRAPCIFEHIYFARPDSIIDDKTVYEVRLQLGERLAEEFKGRGHDIDTVIPIPDTSRPAATSLAEALGKPLREGFIKNRYSGRTFIMPDQSSRTSALRLKLNPIRSEIAGRRILLVDDSIVRGNTVRSIIALVRDMKPAAVHLAIYSPPVTNPCYYGIDMSRPRELIARRYLRDQPYTLERQRAYEDALAMELDLDSLTYLSLDGLDAVASWPKCAACFDGRYPQPLTIQQREAIEENRDRGQMEKVGPVG